MRFKRSAGCIGKLERMNLALRHEEPDRVPVSDFFWGSFLARWRKELGLPDDTDIYRYYDLDWIVTTPNMDPRIRQFDVLRENESEVVVKTGFGATIRKKFQDPMPAYLHFETDTVEKLRAFQFDDPWDGRRFFSGGDNQIAGVGDSFVQDLPPWIETVKELHLDFPVYGSIAEAHELLWRIVGSVNVMLWIGLYPDELGRCIERIGEFLLELTKAEIKAADGLLDGMVIWGDIAYVNGMLFSPDYWRRFFAPIVREQIRICHDNGLPVIYHGCGDARAVYEDFIGMGLDAYNPLEAKAGLDVVELRRTFGHKLAFCGNMDVMEWAKASEEELERIVLTKLNAAKGGGLVFQSDHSVPGNISGRSYDFVVRLVRERGTYPLALGEYNIKDSG